MLDLVPQLLDDPSLGAVFLEERAKTDFAFFCRDLLGFTDMIAAPDAQVPGYSHDDLCRFLQHDPAPFKLILMPRYTFKSHVSTIAYSLFRLLRDPNLRILICSDTNEKAEGFLNGIKNHLTGTIQGSLFRAVVGDWTVDPKRGVWNQQAITIAPRTKAQVEPSVDTAGLESSKTGKHYDLIIFDDLISEKNVTTPELMQKVKEVYRKYLSVLKPGGTVLLIGTRWHFGDLYGQIVAEEQERAKTQQRPVFAVYVRQAEVLRQGQPCYPFSRMGAHSLTQEFLAGQRAQQGSRIYSALYQNDPTDEETAKFKARDFQFYDPPQRQDPDWLASLYLTAALDPIPPHDTGQGDDAALTIVGSDSEQTMYLLDLVLGRLQPSEQIDALFRLHAKWHIRALAVEVNSWQKTLLPEIELRLKALRRSDPNFRLFQIEAITRGSQNSKHADIQGLEPYHERGAIRLPGVRLELLTGPVQVLAMQMLQYPHAQHDDALDSLSMHLKIQRPGELRPIREHYPVTSAAWFERELRKEETRQLARRPRWRRRSLPALTFS